MKQQSDVRQDFISRFRKLREWADDNPEVIEKDAENDPAIVDLCLQIADLLHSLKTVREYDSKYAYHVNNVIFSFFKRKFVEFRQGIIDHGFSNILIKSDVALDAARQFNELVRDAAKDPWTYLSKSEPRFAQLLLDDLCSSNSWLKGEIKERPPRNFSKHVTGIDYVLEFIEDTGLDLSSAMKRRGMTPNIFVPTHLAKKFNNQEQIALYELLQQALNAFIFGASAASIALMRSVVELVLSEHYGSRG
jgi:hypothetical protein